MLDEDDIAAAENAFVQGKEMTPEKRKRYTYKDTGSVELVEDEYKDDERALRGGPSKGWSE